MSGTIGLNLVIILFLGVNVPAAEAPAKSAPVISVCDKPFMFGFGSWAKAKEAFPAKADGIHISVKNAQGGAGVAGLNVDLTGYSDWSPAMTLAVGEQNKAGALNLHLSDSDGTSHTYKFDLRKLKPGAPQQVVADYGASLAEPQNVEKPGKTPGLESVASLMVIGDWSGNAVDVVLSSIALVPPTDELRAQRARLREIKAKEAEKARLEAEAKEKARKDMLANGAPHPADGPEVKHVCAAAPDVIAITLQAAGHVSNQLVPYVVQPGDQVVEEAKDKPRHEVKDGKIVDYFQKALFRKVDNKRTKVGLLSPNGKHVFIEGKTKGQLLDETVVDVPEAYTIQSADDAAYAKPQQPAQVFRKGKPDGYSQPLPFLYTVSLKLPAPLKEGATYTIRFVGVNTSRETVAYVHKPRQTRSIALHAIQTGYRPDDPYKRAYLSFWMGVDKDGKHGSCTPDIDAFELVDAAGKTVFTGKAERAKKEGEEEQISIHEKLDYTKA
ncbi:MAG: hypothetical protein FJ279_27015, partial [Planctomycetes bacterium]|nr:hypothetical protein [Planctomycetota bacterium]